MVLYAKKCHFVCFGNDKGNETFLFNNNFTENSNEQNILGVITDNKFSFKSQAYVFRHIEIKKPDVHFIIKNIFDRK